MALRVDEKFSGEKHICPIAVSGMPRQKRGLDPRGVLLADSNCLAFTSLRPSLFFLYRLASNVQITRQ